MRNVIFLVRRNTSLFLHNKFNILLSFASIVVVLSLYVLFLRNFMMDLISQTGMEASIVHEFTDRMMFAGLLVVINTTTCFGILQICVNDTATGIKKDFLVTPISSFSILLGYWFTSTIIAGIFTELTVLLVEFYFKITYHHIFSFYKLIQITWIVLFSSCINSGILLSFSRKLSSTTTFSTFANLYGTVLGFLAGTYLPYYFYPAWLKPFLFFFPPTQLTSIFRQEYINTFIKSPFREQTFPFIELMERLGIQLTWKNNSVTAQKQWALLILALAVILLYLWITNDFKGFRKQKYKES